MTDDELRASWPELGALVAALRPHHPELASRLLDCVQYASTSGEIYNGVGNALWENRGVRKSLGRAGNTAWEQVMDDIERAYKMPRPMRWLMRMWRRI